jgi:hypothetical protein
MVGNEAPQGWAMRVVGVACHWQRRAIGERLPRYCTALHVLEGHQGALPSSNPMVIFRREGDDVVSGALRGAKDRELRSGRKGMKGTMSIRIGLSLRFGKSRGCLYALLLTIGSSTISRSNCQATMANVFVRPFLHLIPFQSMLIFVPPLV